MNVRGELDEMNLKQKGQFFPEQRDKVGMLQTPFFKNPPEFIIPYQINHSVRSKDRLPNRIAPDPWNNFLPLPGLVSLSGNVLRQ
jgi:hypothetical protein